MATATKDTIYIDIDDEITSIIDKVQGSKHKIVALVLPKRASALQSIVNMRLLKRVGEEAEKRLVLITSEANLLPLAGIVGIHVAKTLQSKPTIPQAPQAAGSADTTVDDDEPEVDPSKSVGELAGLPSKSNALGSIAVEETIDVDNTDEGTELASAVGGKKPKAKKIKIPNFESFRLRLFLGVFLIIALIVGWFFAFTVLPKASVTIKTDTTTVTSSISLTVQTTASTVDTTKSIVPAVSKESKKTDSVKVTATGKKNNGTTAGGTMTLTNCINDGASHTVPAGTGFSSGSLSFVTSEAVTLDPALYSASTCKSATLGLSKNVAVTAGGAGGQYNLSARSYNSPASLSTASGSVTAYGSAMSGGTDNIVAMVSQQDVDAAAATLVDKSKDAGAAEVTKALTAIKLVPLPETLAAAAPVVTASPAVGAESADVTVTSVTTYTMLGAKTADLEKLIALDAGKQINLTKQPITDYGLDKAVIRLTSKRDANDQSVSLQVSVTAGTKIDPNTVKKQIAGKKRGDVQSIIEANPGVKDVTVNYSPFWVSKIPNKPAKVTIVFEQTNSHGK